MPNSANRSKNNSGGSKGHRHEINNDSDAQQSKPNPERSDIKHDTDEPGGHPHHSTSRTSNQGRKESSGGEAE